MKKLIIGILSAIVIIAIGASAYNTMAHPAGIAESQAISDSTDQTPNIVETIEDTYDRNIDLEQHNSEMETRAANLQNESVGEQTQYSPPASQLDTSLSFNGSNSNGNGSGGRGQRNGQGSSNGRHGAGANIESSGEAVPNSQNGLQELISLQGTVTDFFASDFKLITDDGQSFTIQLGNQSFVENLGLSLQNDDQVVLAGYFEVDGSFTVSRITIPATGAEYTLRDEYGRPTWSGGKGH